MALGEAFKQLAGPVLDKNLAQGAHVVGAELQKEARALVPVDTSALRISIENSASPVNGGYMVKVEPTLPYAKDIEFGRPPGTQVSPAALMGWARRKGLNAYAVAKSIEKKGSPAQPFMGPALEAKRQSIPLIITQALMNAFQEALGLSKK